MAVLLNWRPQYGIPFYLQYLAHWPEYFIVAEAPGGELMGYSECPGPGPGPAAPGPQRSAGAPAALGPRGGRAASGAELRARARASLRPPRASPGPGSRALPCLVLPCRGGVRQQYPLLGLSAGSPSSLSLPRHPGRPLQRLGKWPVLRVEA